MSSAAQAVIGAHDRIYDLNNGRWPGVDGRTRAVTGVVATAAVILTHRARCCRNDLPSEKRRLATKALLEFGPRKPLKSTN